MLQPDNTYRTPRGGRHELHLHPSSVLFKTPPRHLVFHEVLLTTKQFIRDVTAIDQAWLIELAPHYYSYKNKKLNATSKADPTSQMYEEITNKRRKLGAALERLT